MNVVNFSFRKISIEKFKDNFDKINAKTNIDISDISSLKQDLFKTKEEFLGVKFNFSLIYEPDVARIDLSGDIILTLDSKLVKDVLKEWKDKKMPDDFRIEVFNIILRKAHLKSLELEDEMNLPAHVSFPIIKKENVKNSD
ncbi:MAG TPA: hypothetical protein VMC80_02885 [Patescibacteria group bacterium]|nr:hypothetical protein [Patescibacteria group bacterium]